MSTMSTESTDINSTKSIEQLPGKRRYKSLVVLLVVCLVIFGLGLWLPWHFLPGFLLPSPNEFGDSAAAISGLFSALAFAGVIYAIFMQHDELEMQRKELIAQRQEFQIQNETLRRQRFENTFFSMLELQQQITNDVRVIYNYFQENPNWDGEDSSNKFLVFDRPLQGREAFMVSFEFIKHQSDKDIYIGMRRLLHSEGLKGFEESASPMNLSNFFRHLFEILKYVSQSSLIEDETRQ